MLDRRQILAGLGASVVPFGAGHGKETEAVYLACCKTPGGMFGAAVLSDALDILHVEPLDARGHDTAINPNGNLAVIFARRPGRFAIVLDLKRRERVVAFSPPPDRHFFGHGFFSCDGQLLFATENDYENERGELGIYDATNGFRRLGAFGTGGIGPHEALLLRDGRTIAVANGGIATHPDYPRQKLNLATMAPSITLIDITTGDLIETVALPNEFHQLSIRHMAEAGDGSIWFGGQYEGPENVSLPLVGRYQRGKEITLIHAPDDFYRGMNHYIGSVTASEDGAFVATTSPRGGKAIIWHAQTLEPRNIIARSDICGAAGHGPGFLFTDGRGELSAGGVVKQTRLLWDNHARAVQPKLQAVRS